MFSYVPALDGIRAVAVLGVLLYHGGAPLSARAASSASTCSSSCPGFLITSLLLGEWARRLTIRLGQFWARRARRLLPALLLLLVGVAAYAQFVATPGEFASLRLDSLSTLFYVANWHFIVGGSNYFAQSAQPSPLSHMWSLSIEEQFYIVWPPVVLGLLHLGRRLRPSRQLWPVLAAAVAGALASAAAMRWDYLHHASVTRMYEGTDTRSQDILVGAALAIGLTMWARHRRALPLPVPDLADLELARVHPSAGTAGPRRRPAGPPARHPAPPGPERPAHHGVGAVEHDRPGWPPRYSAGRPSLGLVALWGRLDGPTGFLSPAANCPSPWPSAVLLFAVVTAQAGSLSRALGNPVFVYLGRISYGVYLWHFPLFALLDAERDAPLRPAPAGRPDRRDPGGGDRLVLPGRAARSARHACATLTEWRGWLVTSGAFLGVVAVTVAATLPSRGRGRRHLPLHRAAAGDAGPPVKVAILGDSVAWRLGFALQADQPAADLRRRHRRQRHRGLRGPADHGVPWPTACPIQMAAQCNPTTRRRRRSGPPQWKGAVDQFRPERGRWSWPAGGRSWTGWSTAGGPTSASRPSTPRCASRSSRPCRWRARAGPTWSS